jgi:hypothetical protein
LRNRYTLAILVCLFVINARLFTIKRFGVQEPYMDSFSEMEDYKAVAENKYGVVWDHSIRLHNEHRIILTRWTNVALFVLNHGKWDLLAEACLNAILAGLITFALFVCLGRYFGGLRFVFFAFLLFLAFGLPTAYENILWGFQSQHFYFILFSVIAICCLVSANAGSVSWWIGLVAGILACLTLGSGFYGLLAVVATCGVMALRRDYRNRTLFLTGGICLVLLLIYLPGTLGVHSDPDAEAHSAYQSVIALIRNLAWPNVTWYQLWSAFVIQLPSFGLGIAILLRREALPKSSYVILGLAIWNLLIMLTLSYLRGAYTPYVRYYDYNAFNIVVNGAALLELSRLQLFPALPKPARIGLFAGWSALVMLGCSQLFTDAWNYSLPVRKAELIEERFAVRNLFRTGNPTVLTATNLKGIFPFTKQYAAYTASLLKDPEIYRCLPNQMKPGLEFSPDNEPMSKLARLLLRRSDFVTVGVFFVLAVAFGCSLLPGQIRRDSIGAWLKALTP